MPKQVHSLFSLFTVTLSDLGQNQLVSLGTDYGKVINRQTEEEPCELKTVLLLRPIGKGDQELEKRLDQKELT
jgi:hypothetical protein